MNIKQIILALLAIAALLFTATSAFAYSGFPARDYPGNQYGYGAYFYQGPWGERMVYGHYGNFPNFYGYRPYGYSTYGYQYTVWDMHYGMMRPGYGRHVW